MFIVWRRRPIVTDRPAELFTAYDDIPIEDLDGHVVRTGRHKRGPTLDDPAWKPLLCRHRGPGRIAWTPLLMHAERVAGKPRQRLLYRFPTIRSCCIGDQFLRAAWWYDVDWEIAFQEQSQSGLVARFIYQDRPAIVQKLREVVPRPTPRGVREFTRYRLQKEKEQRRAQDAMFEAMWRAEQRREEEQRRRAEEARQEQERRREEQGGTWGRCSVDPWWVVLELPSPTATAEQVRAQYRKLVMQHHPDRGGDPDICKKVNAAREEAERHFGDRW